MTCEDIRLEYFSKLNINSIMKKIFALLFLVVSLTACETEPLDPSLSGSIAPGTGTGNVTSSIVGSWLYTDFETNTTTTTNVMGFPPTSLMATAEYVSSNTILTFNADGTYTTIGDLEFETFVQGVSQGIQTNTFNDSGTWTLTGNILEFASTASGSATPFDDTTVITINTLNNTDLFLDIEGTSTQNAGGGSIDIIIEGTADFERQ